MESHEDRLQVFTQKFPYERNVFVMMRYREEKYFRAIEKTVRTALEAHELTAHFAKDCDRATTLWDNVRVYMDGCRFGVGVFEEIDEHDFNPNISLELGYLMAQGKRCLLLKERRMPRLPTDICGFLYKDFDIFAIQESITKQINSWVVTDLELELRRIWVMREVARIFADRKHSHNHMHQILWLLHSHADGYTNSELKRAIYAKEDNEGLTLGRELLHLADMDVIYSQDVNGTTRYFLTDLGREAVLRREEINAQHGDSSGGE